MSDRAPRLPWRPLRASARGAWLTLCLWLAALAPRIGVAQDISTARFTDPTTHYAHAVLGDAVEYAGLEVTLDTGQVLRFSHPPGTRVFEDIAPRLWDVTGDGAPDLVVIETDPPQGAQLAVYALSSGRLMKLAATPHIGQTNRWLAPIAAADLDGDGHIEIAYIDRPHLAKTLRVWRYQKGKLTEIATARGLTNHKIGWDFIAGGLRVCGTGMELITANAGWTRILATRLTPHGLISRDIGAYHDPSSLSDALTCS